MIIIYKKEEIQVKNSKGLILLVVTNKRVICFHKDIDIKQPCEHTFHYGPVKKR